jgi:acyl-CoA thioester hydrolase
MAIPVPFVSVQRVYFDDLDALNILHNMRFLLFIERARGALFNAMGFHWEDDLEKNPDKFHVVAEHSIKYLAPVRGEGDLAVVIRLAHLGRTSLAIEARVQSPDGGVRYAEGTTRLVRLDPVTFRPAPWSERFRATVGPLVRTSQGAESSTRSDPASR